MRSEFAGSVRPARPEDVNRLIGVHIAAFPDDRGADARRRNFEHTPFGSFSDLRVLEHGGAIVGHAFLFPFEAFFGGRRVRTAGIASVGIAPEVRGRGLGAMLLTELESEARARGDAIALLYPFRQAFYRKLGYAPVTPSLRIGASPRAIPDAWVKAARGAPLRAATGADLPAMEAAYLGYAARTTGLLVRPAQLWERKLTNERRHAIVLENTNGKSGAIRGYVTFRHEQAEPHADVTLEIDDIVAVDDEARRTLFGAIGAQRDQVRSIAWLASRDDAFVLALEDANRDRGGNAEVEHPVGTLAAGPMVKVLDVEAALGQRGYSVGGSFSFRLGERGPAFAVNVTNGTVRVTRGDVLAKVSFLADAAVGSLFFGGVRAHELARLGSLTAASNELANLDAMVSLPAFETLDAF